MRVPVDGSFRLLGDAVGFTVGDYDRTAPLVIDPTVSYSTLLGGSNSNAAMALAVDATGAAYLAGFTASYNFPTASPVQNFNAGSNDVFVAKLTPSGNALVYATYIGGGGDDRGYGIAVDSTGAAYVAGSTTSANFPVRNALQSKRVGGRNAFVLKLSPAGNSLVFSTYLGGNGSDTANGIALDSSRNVYVAGDTTSTAFPATAGAFQRSNRGSQDAFVAKLNPAGSALVYATFLGGSLEDHAAAVAVDAGGTAYVTGSTWSPDFPVASAYQSRLAGGQDAFVARIAASGSSLVFSTYLGGSGGVIGAPEGANGIALDAAGAAYVTGTTPSSNFPLLNPYQSALRGWSDAFVSKLSAAGALAYSTYVGGSGTDVANAIAVDSGGNAYIAGYTNVMDLITTNPSASPGAYNAFVAELNSAGRTLAGAAYILDTGADTASAIALDASASVYFAGWTLSRNFPVLNGIQSTNTSGYSAFLAKINFTLAVAIGVAPASANLGPAQSQQFTATVTNTSNTAVTWSLSPGVGSISSSGLYTAPSSLSTQQTITVTATSAADATKSASATVTVHPNATVTISPSGTALCSGQNQQFTASVTGLSDTAVTWSIAPAFGSITATGLYTAPSSVTTVSTVTITATSHADSTKSGTTSISLTPCTANIWPNQVSPWMDWYKDSAATLGVKFRSDVTGLITGVRFYKGVGNNGTHIGLLYSSSGTLLAQAAFTGETASGWQSANFASPVQIAANTTYVAAFFSTSGFALTLDCFTSAGVDNPPLHALRTGVDGLNGVAGYGPSPYFPTPSFRDANYWVDVSFSALPQSGPAVSVSPTAATLRAGQTQQFTATVSNSSNTAVTWSINPPLGSITSTGLYTAPASVTTASTVTITATSQADSSRFANATVALAPFSASIWPNQVSPWIAWYQDLPATLGFKFRSDVAGAITGIRFYKGAGNNGTHIGLLYSSNGAVLAQATFTGETASGWQSVNFASPVQIAANTTYVAAFFSTSGFALSVDYFTSAGVDKAPLHALRSGVDGLNAVAVYGSSPSFPTPSFRDSNYWVDVIFQW